MNANGRSQNIFKQEYIGYTSLCYNEDLIGPTVGIRSYTSRENDVKCLVDIKNKKQSTVSASTDEGFEDCLCPDEEDDIFTKSLAVDNLNLQNFLIVSTDRKKKTSDISEIMAYNRIISKTESQVQFLS